MFVCPTDSFSSQIISVLNQNNILIVTGETGSGKSTRIPFFIFLSSFLGRKALICSQPRRLAAINVAKRVADQAKVRLGVEVGYLIRFENCTTKKTRLKFTTDGFLLKEFISSPFLDHYSMVIIDEAHERSLNADLLLSLLKSLTGVRPDLKILITSATLEIQKYSTFFSHCPVFCIPGRTFKVETFFTKTHKKNFRLDCLASLIFLAEKFDSGDILVFLPGREDIDFIGHYFSSWKKTRSWAKDFAIKPIFSGLPWKTQIKAIQRSKGRKVILSTNIAETSLTIPNISFIIDPGVMKHQIFDPKKFSGNLILTQIGRVNAMQRKGRVGRIRPGKCFRLYTKWSFENEMRELSIPEVQKTDLTAMVLFLKVLGVENILSLDWIDFPEKFSLFFSFETLYSLKALGNDGQISNLGREMAEFPVNPMLAKTIIYSRKFNQEKEIVRIAALLLIPFDSYQSMFKFTRTFIPTFFLSDHIFIGNIFKKWEKSGHSFKWCLERKISFKNMQLSNNIKLQLEKTGKTGGKLYPRSPNMKILDIISSGFFLNLAVFKKNGLYKPIFCRENLLAYIHTKSLFKCSQKLPFLICFNELISSKKIYLRVVSPVGVVFFKQFFKF